MKNWYVNCRGGQWWNKAGRHGDFQAGLEWPVVPWKPGHSGEGEAGGAMGRDGTRLTSIFTRLNAASARRERVECVGPQVVHRLSSIYSSL